MSLTIGIDLGTTNSCVSYMEGAEGRIIPSPEGTRTVPSIVAFSDKNTMVVGHAAKRQIINNPKQSFYSVKRLIGQKYNSEVVKTLKNRVTFEIIEAENGDAMIKLWDTELAPQEISAYILMDLKSNAEEYLEKKVKNAIITVPANFNDSQRQATKDAGTISGLEVLRIINEPTAACLAYGYHKKKEGNIFVYDLGGGTFDVSVLEVNEGVFKVLSTRGDSFIGGNDFDRKIVDWLIEKFYKRYKIDLSDDSFIYHRIRDVAEKAKIELSFTKETEINLPYLYSDESGPKHLKEILTRKMLEQLTKDLVDKTIPYIDEALEKADMTKKNIDDIILVGGQTRMPLIKMKLEAYFDKPLKAEINPDEVVASGAAVQGALLGGEMKDIVLLDVTPLSLGIETKGDVFTRIIPMNTTIPVQKAKTFTTVSDNQSTVKIHVLQGEREVASKNKSLGYFELIDIPPAPKGVPQIDVTFKIDADGIVQVSAKDKASGFEQKIKVNPSSGLNPDEVEKRRKEAEKYKEKDIKEKIIKSEKNSIEKLRGALKTSYENLKDRMDRKQVNEFESFFKEIKKNLKKDDINKLKEIREKGEFFQEKLYDIINEIYQSGISGEKIFDDDEKIEGG